jgi:excinuclease ABC subunit C
MNHAADVQYDLDAERLRQVLPDGPGVYCFKDLSGRVLYVGKAKSLKKRVLSYFRSSQDLTSKTSLMMRRACGLDFIITSTEKEAFILESNLIKKFMPRYNVILRDDKQYPCLRLDIKESYPRLGIARRIKKDGAVYFGPFSSANSVRSTHKVIERVFQLRKCKGRGLPRRKRPCLNYQMERCLGPCTYDISVSEYHEIVQQVRFFLEGRNRELVSQLKKDMTEASGHLDFEKAARIRDQISAIEKTVERQHVVSHRLEDQDIIGLSQKGDLCQMASLFVRKGCVVGSRNYSFKDPGGSPSEVMEAYLKQYYSREAFIPEQILISEQIEDRLPITEWLSDLAGKRIVIHRPLKGEKLRLMRMAIANAEILLIGHLESQEKDLMSLVQSDLKLKKIPRFIEGLDISNLQGDMAVGTIVCFVDGVPHSSGYRNYRIKEVNGIDDYGMMAELVERRVSKGQLPDLFLVDGGKGHLSCVKRILERHAITDVTEVASIAKPDENRQEKHNKIYIPGRKNPLVFRADHPVLLLMMRIRDEAHRRAISYHRRLRKKNLTESELDLIPGIGVKRKKSLLQHFKDINDIAKANLEELTKVPGISRSVAKNILSFLQAGNANKEKRNKVA